MRKLNSIIFGCLLILANITSCGMPGPLYQPPEEQPIETKKTSQTDPSTEQQEQ